MFIGGLICCHGNPIVKESVAFCEAKIAKKMSVIALTLIKNQHRSHGLSCEKAGVCITEMEYRNQARLQKDSIQR